MAAPDIGLTLAEVFRRFGPAYRQQYPNAILPSHDRALREIAACRTPALGGHLWHCPECGRDVYVYHGCRNRSCPACHHNQTQGWLARRQGELLGCPYFHLTATVPEGLRDIFRSNQKLLYDLLMSLTAQSVLDVAANPRHLGAMPALLAVLHTWTATLTYHPHVHCLVSGGGISLDQKDWVPTRPGFFLSVRVISRHLRHLFEEALRQNHPELHSQVPASAWTQEWVVHCIPWGQGQDGVREYLARYVFRIAITDRRILAMDEQTVTFQYKDRKGNRLRVCRIAGTEFIRRFLQHVLPRGLHKVRYYGLWHPARRPLAARVRQLLSLQTPAPPLDPEADILRPAPEPAQPFRPTCPHCGCQELVFVREIPRPRIRSP
jgi:hypothetical protein